MFENLIEYEDLQEACGEYFGFSGVKFKRDFGPWKKGQVIDTLWFMFEKAIVEEQSNDGKLIVNCKFQLMPDNT